MFTPASSTESHATTRAGPRGRQVQVPVEQIAMCDGNLRSTIKALIMANEYLETELEELQTAIAAGCAPARSSDVESNAA